MPRKIDYEAKYKAMSAYEDMLRESGVQWIAGIDEAGRGPLAGPGSGCGGYFGSEATGVWR